MNIWQVPVLDLVRMDTKATGIQFLVLALRSLFLDFFVTKIHLHSIIFLISYQSKKKFRQKMTLKSFSEIIFLQEVLYKPSFGLNKI